jgi:hypothetical protein
MSRLRAWLFREEGVSEAATAIFVLPLIAALVFLVIEAGFNVRTRIVIDSTLQDTVRSVSLDGGDNSPRTTSLTGQTWSQVGTQRLQAACTSGAIRATNSCLSLGVTCSPAAANAAGDNVFCFLTTPITYKTLSPLSTNALFSFGFSGLFTTPIQSRVDSVASVGVNG